MALSKGRREQLEQAKKNAKSKAEQQKKAQQTVKNTKSYTGNKVQQTVSGKKPGPTKATNTGAYKGNAVQNTVFGSKNKVTNSNVKQADKVTGKAAKTAKASNYATGSTSTKSGSYAARNQGNMAPKANRGTGKTYDEKGERQKAIDKLNANSMAWHNTTDTAERARLHRANDAIRKHFGMTYNGDTGATYLPKAGGGKVNVSEPVVRAARNAPFNTNFQTQADRDKRYDELNSEIDRMQRQYPYLVAKDMQNRNLGDKAAAAVSMLGTPRLIKAGVQGAQQYNNMSANNKKQADAMFQLYQRLVDEANALSRMDAGKAWGSGIAKAALSVTGAVENTGRYITSAGENALSGALKLAGAQNAGKFWEDVAKDTVNNSFSDAAMQKMNDWAQPVGAAKKAQELAGSGARMLPGMALGAATGTVSKVSSLLDKAPLANASLAAIFGDSAASGTREALQDGANLNQALAYGAGSGLTEVGTEKMFGGIPGLNEGIAKLGSGNRVLDKAFDILGEGAEEATSTLVNPYLKRATYDRNAQNATAQELWDSAKGGMALAGIMQGANAVSERLANRRYGNAPANQTVTTPEQANADMNAPQTMNQTVQQETPQNVSQRGRQNTVQTPDVLYAAQNGTAGQAQSNPALRDINPKLTRAGANAESSVGAAQSGFDPYSRMVNEYGAIPEGMNPARTIDVPQSTNGTDRVSNVARTIMESGVTPDSLIPALENHVAEGLFSHDVKSLKKTLSGATKTIQKKGWQGAFDQWEEVTDGRRAVTDDDIALGQMMYTAAVEAGDTQTAMKLAGDLAVQGTALGRGVNAFKLLKKTTPEGQLYYLQKAVQKIQQEYQSRFDKQANKAAKKQGVPAQDIADQYGLKLNEDLVQEFLNAETQEARDAVVDKIYNDVAQQIPKTAGDIVNAWRYFAMLGNPRTHIRNIMGNVASAAALDASHAVSAVGQKFLPQDQRTRALHTSKAAKQFAKADYANVEAELSGNAYKTEMSEIKQRQKLFPKPLQKVMDANSWALDAEDQVFKKKSYIDSMGNFLTARGWDVNNLTEAQLNEARQHAIQDAKIATFQDASALADKLSQLEKGNKTAGVIIGSLVPFKRTPINVAKRSFELSPLGLLKAVTYDVAQVKSGKMDATKMVDHISQGLTGSGIAALGAFLAAQGLFSAGASDDDKEANLDAGMGQQEYAINIGGKSYTIDWAAPAVVPLAMGGELYEALHQKYDDEETAFNQAMATVSRMFDPMLNMTMLSGIGSTVSSAAYNKSNPLFGIASNVATNFGGQFVPTLFGQIARTVDNTRRTTYADKNSPVPSSVQKFMQRQANKIPGLSQNQPAYTDVWGREQKNGPDNVFARAAYNFFSPGYLADAKGTQAENALKELYQATSDNSVLPSKPQKYYKGDDGTKKFLSASDYSKLTSEGGKISLDAIDKLTKSEAYKQMSNDERIEAVADIYKYAKAIAANQTYGKELEDTIKTVKDSGIAPGLYYAYKEMEDSYNDSMDSWEAFDQTFLAVKNDKSLSEQERNSLYHTLLIKGNGDSTWDKYEKISGKVTAEEFVDALTQSKYIRGVGNEELEGEKGSEKAQAEATEFAKYLDMKGYTGEKRAALESEFGFYSMIRQSPTNYTFDMLRKNGNTNEQEHIGEVESSGITASQYNQIRTLANALQSGVDYEAGKTNAKKEAQAKIVSQNVDNYQQYAAVMNALGRKKFENLYMSGGKLPEDKGSSTGIDVNRASQQTSSAGFVNPTTASNSVVTSGYGGRNAVKTSKGYSSTDHDGIDIGGTGGNLDGQAADSIGGGKVIEVGYQEKGYGNYVVVDHGNGYTSLYGHLQKATVKQGDTVSAGQQVGVIGSTGSSTAPHLHLRVHKDGQSIDPRTVIPGYGG